MSISDNQQLRPMCAADLNQVLAWRNHPEVRRYMYTQHEIQLEEHKRWYERASKDVSRHLLIYEDQGIALGFIQFHTIALGGIADWGFYIAPDAPKGSGYRLGCTALEYAFKTAKYKKICAQALGFNERSIRFHLKLGFLQEGVLRNQHFDGQNYHDVVCFGILLSEWQK